jgi:D-xylose transport system substrate-binding protein
MRRLAVLGAVVLLVLATVPTASAASASAARNVAGNIIVAYQPDHSVMAVFRFEVRTDASGSVQFGYYQTTGLTGNAPSAGSLATVDAVRFFKAASGAPAAEFSGQECGLPATDPTKPCNPYHIIVTDGASIHRPDTFCGNPIAQPSDWNRCTYVFDVIDGNIGIYAEPSVSQNAAPELSVYSFDASFSAMSRLKSVQAAGTGLVGVILPDTVASPRYSRDAAYLTRAFLAAGYVSADFRIDNAHGSDASELALARADIAMGAKVLIVDPLDPTVGAQIQSLAARSGVLLISYDRPTFQGTSTYTVTFDNEQVGRLIGQGFEQCVKDWGVTRPQVFQLNGGQDVDQNAIDFAIGYNAVLWGTHATPLTPPRTNSLGYILVGDQIAPGWDNSRGQAVFQAAYASNPAINATLEANDGLANAVIAVLKARGVGPRVIPTTGQDATLEAMVNILQGYQCGTVYKPVYLEAQAAVALATYLRAGQAPPAGLVNGVTTDPGQSGVTEPAVLLPRSIWVSSTNMEATVIKDGWVSAKDLCGAVGAAVCRAAGIK